MKIILSIVCIVAMVIAEPPVGDGYPSHDHSHDHNQDTDFQRSLSEEYGPPSFGARSIATEYGPPARSRNLASTYGPPNARLSQEYGPPNARLSQEYGPPNARLSQEYGPPNARLSQEYGTPNQFSSRSLSTEYGVPETRNSLPTSYGAPQNAALRSGPSSEYGAPEARISQEYGVPSQRNFGSPSQKYGAPKTTARKSFGRVSQEYGAPLRKSFGARSFGSSASAGYARSTGSYSVDSKALSRSYGAPRDVSDTYGTPERVSQGYNAPRALNQKTDAIVSSYAAVRSPSDTYGVPSGRDAMPSEQYGAPEQYNNQGYSYARDALNELLNQEPANYDFTYKVNDIESGSDFGHTETRHDNHAEGSYFVVLPDGTKQVVEYEADERGFKPKISIEPAGYDDNAQDLARSGDGPY